MFNSIDLPSVILDIVKYLTIVITTVSGIYALQFDFRDKRTKKITPAGRKLRGILILSGILTIIAQVLDTQLSRAKDREQLEKNNSILYAVNKTLTPIGEFSFDIGLTVDTTNPEVAKYINSVKDTMSKNYFSADQNQKIKLNYFLRMEDDGDYYTLTYDKRSYLVGSLWKGRQLGANLSTPSMEIGISKDSNSQKAFETYDLKFSYDFFEMPALKADTLQQLYTLSYGREKNFFITVRNFNQSTYDFTATGNMSSILEMPGSTLFFHYHGLLIDGPLQHSISLHKIIMQTKYGYFIINGPFKKINLKDGTIAYAYTFPKQLEYMNSIPIGQEIDRF